MLMNVLEENRRRVLTLNITWGNFEASSEGGGWTVNRRLGLVAMEVDRSHFQNYNLFLANCAGGSHINWTRIRECLHS